MRLPIQSIALLSCSALCAWLSTAAPSQALTAEEMPTGSDPVKLIWYPNPPYAISEQGVPTGFEIDLWRMVAENRQIPYQISKADSFKALIAAISSGEADVAISGILINENRSKSFQFSVPTASSGLKLYTLDNQEPTAFKLLRILFSQEVMLIFLGIALIACVFAIPVWMMERHRPEFANQAKRHQFIFVLQKTLLLSTDHTKRTKTRLLSIASLFARVLLTGYFASYILKIASSEPKPNIASTMKDIKVNSLKHQTFAAIPGSIQASILKSMGAKSIDCDLAESCIRLLQTGKADAILDDSQTMQKALGSMPALPKVVAASENLMPLFMAFGISNRFKEDPRSRTINDAIARSYYDGNHAQLSKQWLRP